MRVSYKHYLILSFLSLIVDSSVAQVGIGTLSPSASSALEVSSQINGVGIYRGFMPPRVPTDVAKDAIPVQAEDKGMMVFVLNTGCLDIFNGTFWEHINCTESVPPLEIPTDVWINELHYNNVGGDTGEFIEIAGVAGLDLSMFSLVLYNGATGLVYDVSSLTSVLTDDTSTGFGFETVNYQSNGIQNGNPSPDGVALVDASGIVRQFLSYGGATFTASNGPAAGLISTDIGVAQTGDAMLNPVGSSLQLTGIGSVYADFLWSSTTTNTSSAINLGQTIN